MSKEYLIIVHKNGTVRYIGDKSQYKEFFVSEEVFELLTLDPTDPWGWTSQKQWKPIYDEDETIIEAFELLAEEE